MNETEGEFVLKRRKMKGAKEGTGGIKRKPKIKDNQCIITNY